MDIWWLLYKQLNQRELARFGGALRFHVGNMKPFLKPNSSAVSGRCISVIMVTTELVVVSCIAPTWLPVFAMPFPRLAVGQVRLITYAAANGMSACAMAVSTQRQ